MHLIFLLNGIFSVNYPFQALRQCSEKQGASMKPVFQSIRAVASALFWDPLRSYLVHD